MYFLIHLLSHFGLNGYIYIYIYIYPSWLDRPSGPRPPHCWGFEIRLRHTTLGRTPLDDWSISRRALHLTTHNIHKRQTSIPLAGFEPAIPVSEKRLRTSGCQDRPYTLCALVTIFEDVDIQRSNCTRRLHPIITASFQTLLWNTNHSSS